MGNVTNIHNDAKAPRRSVRELEDVNVRRPFGFGIYASGVLLLGISVAMARNSAVGLGVWAVGCIITGLALMLNWKDLINEWETPEARRQRLIAQLDAMVEKLKVVNPDDPRNGLPVK